ncbi:PadR family transcriptional regulator [Trinickia terrae]|nr:PadR family transcriptional regulator [Trinickia terrae]
MRHHHHTRFFGGRAPMFADAFSLHALWHAIGRDYGHRGGGGGFWGGRGGFDNDGDGLPRGRKFTGDDLQLLLLALIAEEPRHGYELIKALEARSNGFYAPSPGMVYPALTYLEELGYVTVQAEGNRKRYALAEPGREHLAENRERVDMMLAKLAHIAHRMDSVRRAYAGEEAGEAEPGGWLPELHEAKKALKRALIRHAGASTAEQQRIAAILLRAAAEIEGGKPAGDDSAAQTP